MIFNFLLNLHIKVSFYYVLHVVSAHNVFSCFISTFIRLDSMYDCTTSVRGRASGPIRVLCKLIRIGQAIEFRLHCGYGPAERVGLGVENAVYVWDPARPSRPAPVLSLWAGPNKLEHKN